MNPIALDYVANGKKVDLKSEVKIGNKYYYVDRYKGGKTGVVEAHSNEIEYGIMVKFVDTNEYDIIDKNDSVKFLYYIKEGGKRKSRRNRKSKKGKRSRKARKSRRKSNRRRGRR